MRRFLAGGALLALAMLTATACTAAPDGARAPASAAPPTTSAEAGPSSTTPRAATTPEPVAHAPVRAARSPLGRILVDAEGRTLYYFDQEADGVPACYGECAETWRPYLTEGAPDAGEGADRDLLGTADRTDGTTQVAYAGRPLYHHAADTEPGQVTGNGVERFGGVWRAVTPKGEPA